MATAQRCWQSGAPAGLLVFTSLSVVGNAIRDRLRRDSKAMERGYYEDLTSVARRRRGSLKFSEMPLAG
jgi:hypothetical protein